MGSSCGNTRWKGMGYNKRLRWSRLVRREAGFTLVELLLALFLFALIASVIFASFAAVASGVEKGRQSMELYRVGRVALLRMSQEVSATVSLPRTVCNSTSSPICLRGQKGSGGGGLPHDRIDFPTIPYRRYNDKVPGYDVCNVAYYVADNSQGLSALFREEDCSGEDPEHRDQATRLELTDLVVGLEITYYDASKNYDEWPLGGYDGKNSLPCLVRLALTLRDVQLHERTFITTVALPMRGSCEAN